MAEKETSWQAPNFEAPDDVKLGFVQRAIDFGIRWNSDHIDAKSMQKGMDILAGKTGGDVSTPWAKFTTGDLKRAVSEIVETLADIRPFWGYSTDNKAFEAHADMLSKTVKAVYLECFVDRSLKDALQMAAVTQCGFLHPIATRSHYGMGELEFQFMALGQPDVLPVQLPRDRNYQKAYIVTLAIPFGVAEAHARFPEYQQYLKPFAKKRYGRTKGGEERRSYDQSRWRMHSLESQLEQYCVPLDSEILTREGWKKYNEITVGQEVMGYNQETGKNEWTTLNGINIFKDKEVYEYGTKGFTVRCTKDHRWAVRTRVGKHGNHCYKSELKSIDECKKQMTVLIQCAESPDGPGLTGMKVDDYLKREQAVDMVMKMTAGERRSFILAMLYGEGNKRVHPDAIDSFTTEFSQNPGPVHDAMKLACALEGIATSSRSVVNKGKRCQRFTLLQNPYRGLQTFKKKLVSTEDVWCPTTALGTWIMKQGDVITITGNCDIYYTYILDLRINFGELDPTGKPILGEDGNPVGKELEMGQVGTSWHYKVPYVGQMIDRFENGRMVNRPATIDDCRVYPQRRLMISCDTALMYDGPAFDSHGMIPLVPFYFDKFAWGDANSLFDGTWPLQDAIDDLARSIYRVAMARAKPGKVYNNDITTGDKNAKLTSRQAETLDPFDAGVTWAVDGDIKEPVLRPPMPEWCYNIPEWLFKVIEILQNSIQRQLGLDQIKALEKLRANIQDPEKALDAEGPVVMGTSRSMEMGLRDMGEMMKFLILQYMTTGRIMQIVGAEAIAPQVFDYAPDMVIPSHMPGEETIDAEGNPVDSNVDSFTRAKNFARNIRYFITPHSLHYIAQNKFKLNLLAAQGKGVVIDPQTMAQAFEIPNWGSIEGSTVKEKVFNWGKEQLTEKADIAKLAKALGFGGEEEPPGKPGPAKGKGGRPATNKKSPHAVQKGIQSGGRVVVSTS